MTASVLQPGRTWGAGPRSVGLRLLLPYATVALGWIALESAWLAIGLYHVGILAMAGPSLGPRFRALLRAPGIIGRTPRAAPWRRARFSLSLGSPRHQTWAIVLCIPILTVAFLLLLPHLLRPGLDPAEWLAARGLSGESVLAMAFVYGCAHPFLEEIHYQPLRARAPVRAHLSYAGYHGLVLDSCFRDWATLATVVCLFGVSMLFHGFERGRGEPRLSLLIHVCADLVVAGVVLHWAGWL